MFDYFTEINKLATMLDEAKVPYEMGKLFSGWQISYPSEDNRISDVICHQYSYGREEGLLEMMGLTEDDGVEGYLTAEEVFERWHKHYCLANWYHN